MMKPLKPARRDRSVSMELTPDDAIRLVETTSEGGQNWINVPVDSVAPLAFVLLNDKMRGRLDAVDALKRFLSEHGIPHDISRP
jgi:hypothetical protein